MSVRRQKKVDQKTGKARWFWIVDIEYTATDGTKYPRIRRVPRDNTKVGAERKEREIIQELEAGTWGKKKVKSMTFATFAGEYLKECVNPGTSKPSTVQMKNTVITAHLVPHFGKMRLGEIDKRAVEAFKKARLAHVLEWGDSYSPRTINNHLATLRVMLRTAVEWDYLPEAPEVKLLKLDDQEDFQFLDFEDADKFKAEARKHPLWGPVFITMLNTGMRTGEILALRWDNVNLQQKYVYVRESVWKDKVGTPKSGKSRKIPLNAEAVRTLQKNRHLRGPLVFCRDKGGRLQHNALAFALERLCLKAGVERMTPHALRHTFASHLAMRSVPLKAIQELMGHAKIEQTLRYAHLTPDAREDAVGRLDEPAPELGEFVRLQPVSDGHRTATNEEGVENS